jgi:hypothetical protein
MSSKRNLRRKSCDRKKQFGTKDEAIKQICWMRFKDPTNEWLTCYRCRSCGGWHIGHMPGYIRKFILNRREWLTNG